MQVGRPEEIYRKPENLFVANFIGTTNQLPGCIVSKGENKGLLKIDCGMEIPVDLRDNFEGNVTVAIRPEHICFSESSVRGTVISATFLGDFISYEIELDGALSLSVNQYGNMGHIHRSGERVCVNFPPKCVAAYADTGEVVTL